MSTKHTPGPWRSFDNAGSQMQSYNQSSGVAGTGDNLGQLIAGCFHDISGGIEQASANARLIAAAPELLALLIESQSDIGGDWRERRDALIAKSTGK